MISFGPQSFGPVVLYGWECFLHWGHWTGLALILLRPGTGNLSAGIVPQYLAFAGQAFCCQPNCPLECHHNSNTVIVWIDLGSNYSCSRHSAT